MVLVLGYGNTLRSDDGFGPAVASYLQCKVSPVQAESTSGCSLEILSEQQLLPEHAEKVAGKSLVIFVDASQTTETGRIVCLELTRGAEAASQGTDSILPHSFSPATILALADSVYGHSPEAYLYTVGAASLALGEKLSPPVEAAVPKVVEMILSKLAQSNRGCPGRGER